MKNHPLILPESSAPLDAKFADKHNPDTRRRRCPTSSLLTTPSVNNLIGYPLGLTAGSAIRSPETLATFIQAGIPMQTALGLSNNVAGLPTKVDYNSQRLTQGLLSSSMASKYPVCGPNASVIGQQEYPLSNTNNAGCPSNDSHLSSLAAAASAILGAPATAFVGESCLRPTPTHPCAATGAINGTFPPTNPLALIGPSNDATLLDSRFVRLTVMQLCERRNKWKLIIAHTQCWRSRY